MSSTEASLREPAGPKLTKEDTTARHALVLLRGFWTMLLARTGQSYAVQFRKVLEYYKRLQIIVEIHRRMQTAVNAGRVRPEDAAVAHNKALRELCASVGLDARAGCMPFRPGEPDTVERTAAQLVQLAMVLDASEKQAKRSSGNQKRADLKNPDDIWRTIWIPPEARAEFERDSELTPANLDCKSGPTPAVKDVIFLLNAIR
jgi:hypothetical protein